MTLEKFRAIPRAVSKFLLRLSNDNQFLTIFVFFFYIVRIFKISQKSMYELITFIPDDAFYYLTIAKQKNEAKMWTFDGVNSTSGFHYLHAKVVQIIYVMLPEISVKSLFIIFGILSSFGLALLLYAILCCTSNVRNKLFFVIPFLLPATLRLTEMMMESWIIPIILGMTILLAPKMTSVIKLRFLLLSTGFLGVLARTDFLLITVCVFASVLGLEGLRRFSALKSTDSHREMLKIVTVSHFLIGSILGEAFLSGRNYFLSKEIVQMSVQIKRKWSDILGNPIELSVLQFFKFTSPFEFPTLGLTALKMLIAFLALFLLACISTLWKNRDSYFLQEGEAFCLLYVLVSIPLLTFFFQYNAGSLQPWYAVTYIPTLICTVGSMYTILAKNALLNLWFFSLLIFLLLSSLFGPGMQGQFKSHEIMYQAAIALRDENPNERIGAWNAGILKYFSSQQIVNLDGLMNDSAAKYILSDTLYDYISKNEIERLIDFSGTISNPKSEKKYGLIKGEISRCFRPIRSFTIGEYASPFGTYTEYRLKPNCDESKR